jgi:uncharacterized protein
MIIWIDADACPRTIKDIIIKAALRLQVETVLVANQTLTVPKDALIRSVRVDKGPDVADQYIVDQCDPDDIVITADIPLADKVVSKGALAINPRGELYTEESIRQKLSIRNFMTEMRDAGEATGGPKPFSDKDKHKFAAAFDKIMSQKIRAAKR